MSCELFSVISHTSGHQPTHARTPTHRLTHITSQHHTHPDKTRTQTPKFSPSRRGTHTGNTTYTRCTTGTHTTHTRNDVHHTTHDTCHPQHIHKSPQSDGQRQTDTHTHTVRQTQTEHYDKRESSKLFLYNTHKICNQALFLFHVRFAS